LPYQNVKTSHYWDKIWLFPDNFTVNPSQKIVIIIKGQKKIWSILALFLLKTDRKNHMFRPAFFNIIAVLLVNFNGFNQNSYRKISQWE
jgi:hypothetical protein